MLLVQLGLLVLLLVQLVLLLVQLVQLLLDLDQDLDIDLLALVNIRRINATYTRKREWAKDSTGRCT